MNANRVHFKFSFIPPETEEETLKNLYRRASEDDLDSQKKLLHHLLQTLPSSDVADAIAQCIKARMADVTATTWFLAFSLKNNLTIPVFLLYLL